MFKVKPRNWYKFKSCSYLGDGNKSTYFHVQHCVSFNSMTGFSGFALLMLKIKV